MNDEIREGINWWDFNSNSELIWDLVNFPNDAWKTICRLFNLPYKLVTKISLATASMLEFCVDTDNSLYALSSHKEDAIQAIASQPKLVKGMNSVQFFGDTLTWPSVDWKPYEWKIICGLFGLPPQRTKRISIKGAYYMDFWIGNSYAEAVDDGDYLFSHVSLPSAHYIGIYKDSLEVLASASNLSIEMIFHNVFHNELQVEPTIYHFVQYTNGFDSKEKPEELYAVSFIGNRHSGISGVCELKTAKGHYLKSIEQCLGNKEEAYSFSGALGRDLEGRIEFALLLYDVDTEFGCYEKIDLVTGEIEAYLYAEKAF
jgi:hypothetical protein